MWICEKNARCVDECDDCQHYIEVEPVRHGKWVKKNESSRIIKCTECGREKVFKENYCPNCGAKMDGE